ncbi:long-chain-fatty-acid--CoA ligase 1-like isoform X1 [Argiope bruennichi]|uniref:long-chain-fatty-acid--CoA ligase 1-like isoform X1 n=2 Tax=Argiope bruennichi TaxID=94029 RepID=UPI0024941E2B|nr:long-chain-fatty-acid--CoA ligase 1-like isoform X1 [Argiope bruennichi]
MYSEYSLAGNSVVSRVVKFPLLSENPMEDYLQYIGGTVGIAALTGAAAATAIYMAYSPTPISPPVDIDDQSCEIPNSGGARQSRLAPPGGFTSFLYEDAKTLYEMMQRGNKISGNGNCLGYKISKTEYAWASYKEVIERSSNVASGLVHIGMEPGQSSFIGIYSQNSVEWILTEQACYNQSTVIVPLYDTLGPHACTFIINQAEIKFVICDKEEKAKSLLEKSEDTPCLKHIIVVNGYSNETKQIAIEKGVQLNTLKEIEELGAQHPAEVMPPKPEDIATVCYTSGTTGDPKGVMLTHANIIIDACAVIEQLGEYAPNKDDVMMSFLPLAHMLERLCEVTVYINGGSLGFFGGDVRTLMDDLRALRPTIMPAVPRLLNRIYDKVIAGVNSSLLKKLIFKLAMRMKQSELEKLIIRNNSIWDRVVFKPVREGMGGRMRLLVCGSAPLAGNVLTFIRCALGCVVVEGYGQTECVAPCTLNIQGDYSVGHVGPPISCCHIKLVDVPEMEYYAKDKKGEICIKGLNVFKGYFKDEQKTKETIDSDGWLHTGDIGMWLPNGSLKIVDRRKHIFKLAQGEYIAPEKIENIYLSSQYVSQIFVHGESLQSCLVAVIVPDKEVLTSWCKEKGIEGSWEEICRNKAIKELILNDITRLGKKAGLKSFEQVKDIYVHSGMFTVDNGLLTPTLKTKRPDCRKCFMDVIESMYRLMG